VSLRTATIAHAVQFAKVILEAAHLPNCRARRSSLTATLDRRRGRNLLGDFGIDRGRLIEPAPQRPTAPIRQSARG
jgi:hypothetical protein